MGRDNSSLQGGLRAQWLGDVCVFACVPACICLVLLCASPYPESGYECINAH